MIQPERGTTNQSPRRLLLTLLLSIFIVDLATTTFSLALQDSGLPWWLAAAIDAIILTFTLFLVLLFVVVRPLRLDIAELEQAKTALQTMQEQLELRVRERTAELEQRNRESHLLAEMTNFLQACSKAEEAYDVIARTGQQLFPGMKGALFVYGASRDVLEALATWGELALSQNERVFAPDECWALRRGRPYLIEDPAAGLPCRHMPSPRAGQYVCVPMTAQGEVLGVMHLRSTRIAAESADGSTHLNEPLAVTLAEHAALALTNIKLRATLRLQSVRDPLTGLFNRRYMEETLERELRRAERSQGPLGVVMLDLDHFKLFNDTHGHGAGDVVLHELSALLKAQVRGADIACRYGGEEFALILPAMPRDIVRQRLEALRLDVKRLHVLYRGQSLAAVTMSAGIAMFPENGADNETLLRAADQALYQAKAGGRDRVVTADTPAVAS